MGKSIKARKECDICHRKVINLQAHMKTHIKSKTYLYECHLCNSKFANREDLTLHTENAHKSVSENQCRMCNFILLDKTKLNYHLKMNHDLTTNQYETLIQTDIQEIVNETQHNQSNLNPEHNKRAEDDEMFKLKCTIFKQSNLVNNFIQVSQILCKNITSANLVAETSSSENIKLREDISKLRSEIKVLRSKPFACTYCESKFSSEINMD